MTNQEIFEKVAKHLLDQGRRSTLATPTGDEGACAYRGTGGAKCAVGCLKEVA